MAKEADISNTLKEALSFLHSDEHGTYWQGQFQDMGVHLHVASFDHGKLVPVAQEIRNVQQDIWNTCTLIQRLEWLRNLAIKGQVGDFIWMQFASLDIEHFHVELRSILDYVANILVNLAEEPGQVRKRSFRKLYQWLDENPGNKDRLGKEASELVLSASWYSGLRGIRDAIQHQGAFTLVFGSPGDGILFQVHKSGFQRLVKSNDALMWNENVVDFQLYAGLYFAKTLVFLERLGNFLASRIPKQSKHKDARDYYSGLAILRDWMGRLLAKVGG